MANGLCSACNIIPVDIKKSRYCRKCHNLYMRIWRKTHPLNSEQKRKDICRSYAYVYLKRGKIKRPTLCQDCGIMLVEQMHHKDYSEPLKIIWLCKNCHKKRH